MKELLAGIVAAVLSVFGGHQAVTQSASNAAAAAASVAPSAIVATSSAANPSFPGAEASSTIVYQTINQPTIERIVERTVQTAAPTGYVTQEAFTTAINELSDRFGRIISGSTYPAPADTFASGGVWNAVALTNRIDHLSGTSLSDITVDGVSGLTDADIPDSITASNYLPLSGGLLSFASSTLFSVFNGAYFGATATSSFDSVGALTLATPLLVTSGGTGANTFGQGWIFSSGGTAALAASTSPTVAYLTATSTSQASTFPYASTTALTTSGTAYLGLGAFTSTTGTTTIASGQGFTIGGSQFVVQQGSGNVGIGTTQPGYRLQVAGSFLSSGGDFELRDAGTVDVSAARIFSNSNRLYLQSNGVTIRSQTASPLVTIQNGGAVGIGTSTPWRKLSVTGTVGFDGLTGATGAGSLCLSANNEVVYNSGSDSCLSSTRATKHDITGLDLSALDMVAALQPVSFIYNNDASSTVRYGFIAEDAAVVDAHLATYDAAGAISGIDDRSIISIVVKAIQQLSDRVESYFTRTEQLEARVVALEAQLAASGAGQSPAPSDEEEGAPDTEAPTITINGNNPATLSVGDTYNDLGATVTDNVDLNLGIHVFVGGTPMDQAVLDTSEPNEWHIHYVATDNAGNTATSTRTVIVESPSIVPSDTPVDEPEGDIAEEPELELEEELAP